MFSMPALTRPDRCELCRFSTTGIRSRPFPFGSVSISFSIGAQAETYEVLVCKRMPPTPNAEGSGVSPVVFPGDYCGEFKAKDVP